MSQFEISGKMKAGVISNVWRTTWQPFTRVVESNNDNGAREKIYSLMGSEHGLKRNLVKIEEVKRIE